MSERAAPRVFVTYAHESLAHKEQVREFATFLRVEIGLDVHLDQWYDSRRRDWSAWAIDQLASADFILVIASPEYKRRADGAAPPAGGRGSQFEAAIIRDNLTKNLRKETERVLPVVLPGRSIDEIPTFLNAHSTTRFHVDAFTREGVSSLLAAITGNGRFPLPERGKWLDDPYHAPEGHTCYSELRHDLLSEDTEKQIRAARSISNTRQKTAVPLLVESLKIARDPEARFWMIVALGRIGGEDALEALQHIEARFKTDEIAIRDALGT